MSAPAATGAQPWYTYPVTQAFGQNGERGVDLGMPVGTPIYAPYGGVVLGRSDNTFAVGAQPQGAGPTAGEYSQTGYNQWGGEVDILLNSALSTGQNVMYFFHLDQLAVVPGQVIQPGQLIGWSGGENSLSTTNVQPGYTPTHIALPQYSSGPHIEWGFYNGGNWNSNINPAPYLAQLRQQGLAILPGGASPLSLSGAAGGIDLNPADWVAAIQTGFTDAAQRIGLVTFGAVLVLVGLVVLFFGGGEKHPDGGGGGGAPTPPLPPIVIDAGEVAGEAAA